MSINVNVHANTDPLVRDVHAAVDRINRSGRLKIRIDDKGVTQPLGNMKRGADEFTKSLEASNARVLAFGASVGVINAVAGAFKGLVQATMEVEKNLTDINVVMGLTTGQLDKFGGGLMKVAAETGAGFRAASEAATEFARQGLSVNETLKRTKDALILTRLTGMKAADSVKSLTAAMNTFKGEIADSTALVSKFAAVDVKFAVSAEDFAQAIARAGQSARSAGVDINQLIGLVTAAQERTARGGAVIGNAFKTIFTRVRRSSTLAELENLGIAVRDLQGKTLPAMKIMQSLANTYDTLTDAQRAYISQNVAGVFQINILKAALADLGKTNSVTAQATAIAAGATDESNRKNEQLRQTMSALATETGVAIQELAKKIGDIALAPGINKVLDGFKGMAEGLGGILGDGEQEGNKFAQGLLRGVGNILTGPGLVMFAAVAGKLFVNAVKYAQQSLGSLLNINKTANARRNIEQSLMQVLTQNAGLQKEMLRTDISREQKERTILQLIQQQTQEASRLAALTKSMAPVMMRQGIGPGLSMRSGGRGASGFIPNYAAADDEKAEARKGGYAPGAVRTMRMPGVGSVVYNTAERVKKFPGLTQPAIMPPGGKAKDNYTKEFYGTHGFDPYMAGGGYVPNFAKIGTSQAIEMIRGGRNPQGWKYRKDLPDDIKTLAQYNMKSSAIAIPATQYQRGQAGQMRAAKDKKGIKEFDASRLFTLLALKGGGKAHASLYPGGKLKEIYGRAANADGVLPKIKFSISGFKRANIPSAEDSEKDNLEIIQEDLLKSTVPYAVNFSNKLNLGDADPTTPKLMEAALKKGGSGALGALSGLVGAIFEASISTRLPDSDPDGAPGKFKHAGGSISEVGGDFDVRDIKSNSIISTLFDPGPIADIGDYKTQANDETKKSMANKIAKEMIYRRHPDFVGEKNRDGGIYFGSDGKPLYGKPEAGQGTAVSGKLKDLSSIKGAGFVPNFASLEKYLAHRGRYGGLDITSMSDFNKASPSKQGELRGLAGWHEPSEWSVQNGEYGQWGQPDSFEDYMADEAMAAVDIAEHVITGDDGESFEGGMKTRNVTFQPGGGPAQMRKHIRAIRSAAKSGKPYQILNTGTVVGHRVPSIMVKAKALIDRMRQREDIPIMKVMGTLNPNYLEQDVADMKGSVPLGFSKWGQLPKGSKGTHLYRKGDTKKLNSSLKKLGIKRDSGGFYKDKPVPMSSLFPMGFAGGFVPNFADPLSDAVGREMSAGVPVSKIRVGSHRKLVGSSNPAGLGVTNTDDEPNGLRDVLGATGIVPNYSKLSGVVEFVDPQKKVDRLGKEAEEAAEEVSKYKDEVTEAAKAKEDGAAEEKKLKKEVTRLRREEKAYANEVGKKKKGSTRHLAAEKKLTQALEAVKKQKQTNANATKKNTDATDALTKAEKKSAQATKKIQKAQASQQRRGMLGMTAMMGAQMAVGQMQGMEGFETSKSMQGIAGGVGMASTGASMGMMFGPWGTAVGALAGGVYGVLDGFNKAEEAARKLAKAQVVAREAAEAAEFSRKSGLAAGLLSQENISSLSDRWKGSDTLGGSTERKFTDPVVFTEKYFKAWNALALEGDTELKARNLGRKGDAAQNWKDTRGQRLYDDLGIKDGGFTPITRIGPKRGDIKGDGTFESRKRLAGSDQMVVEFTGNEEFTDDSAPTDYKEEMGVTFAQFRAMKMPGGAIDRAPEEQRIWQRMQQDSGGFSATQMKDVLGADWRGGPNANRLSMIASLGGSRVGANPMLAEQLHKGAESGGGAGLLYEAAKEALKGEGQNTEGAVRKKYQDALVSWIEASVDPSSAPKEYDTTSWIKSGKKGGKGQEISQSEYDALDAKEKAGDTWSKVGGKKTLGFAELVAMAGSDDTSLSQLMELANQMETASMQGGVAKMTGDKQSAFIARKQDAHHRVDVNVMSKTQALADATRKYTQRVDKTRAIWDGLTSETSKVWRDYNMGMRKAGDKHTTTILKAESDRKKGLLSIALEDRGEQRTNLMGALGIQSTGDTALEDQDLLRAMEALSAQELHEILNKIITNDSKRVGVMRDLENKQILITKGAHNSLDASEKQLENSKEINLVLQTRLQLKTRMKRFDENTALKEEVELLKQAVALTQKMGEGNIALARMQGGTASQRYGVGQKNRKLQYENSVESSKVRHGKDLLSTIKSQPELRGIVDSDVGFDINEYQKLESSQAKADYLMGFKDKLKKKMIQDEADSYAADRAPLSGKAANLEGALKLLPYHTGGQVTMQADPRTGKGLGQLAGTRTPGLPGMAGVNTLMGRASWKEQMWEGGLPGQGGKIITTTQKDAMDKIARDRRRDWDDSAQEYTETVAPDGTKGAHRGGWTYKGRMAPPGKSGHPDRGDFNMWEKGFTDEESRLFKEARILPSKRGGDVAKMAASYKAQDHVLDIDATRKNLENERKINAEKLKNLDTTNKQVAAHSNVDEGLTQVIEKLRLKGDMHKEVLAKMEAEYEIAKKLAEIEHKEKRGEGAFGRGMNRGMNQIQDRVETFSHTMGTQIPEMFSNGMSSAMMNAIRNGGKLKDVLRDAALSFLDTFNQKMMGHFADQATMALFGSGEQRTRKGYAKGGLVGFNDGGLAMVSNQEYRMRPEAVKKYGVGMMDAVNSGHFQRRAGGGPSWAAGLGGIAGGFLASKLFGKKEEEKHVVREKDRFETDGAWKRQNMSAHYMQNNERVQTHVGELRMKDQENTQKFIEKAEKKAQMGRQLFTAVASLGAQKLGAKLESSGAFGKADMAMGFGKDVKMPDGTLAKVSPDGSMFKMGSDAGARLAAESKLQGPSLPGQNILGFEQSSGFLGGKKDHGYMHRSGLEKYAGLQDSIIGPKMQDWQHDDGSFNFSSREKRGRLSTWANSPWKKGSVGEKATEATKKLKEFIKDTGRKINPLRKATGGKIVGQSGIDQIPTMLSEGEYVIRADAARKMGVPALDKINAGRFNKGGIVTNASSDPGGSLGGASTNNVSITVNVDKSGGESSGGDDEKSGDGGEDKMDKFSSRIKDQVITVIKEESRPGGLLDDGA